MFRELLKNKRNAWFDMLPFLQKLCAIFSFGDEVKVKITTLIKNHEGEINRISENGTVALSVAINYLGDGSSLECIKFLLENGADPNITYKQTIYEIVNFGKPVEKALLALDDKHLYKCVTLLIENGFIASDHMVEMLRHKETSVSLFAAEKILELRRINI